MGLVCKSQRKQKNIFIPSLRACRRDAGPLSVGGHLETSRPAPETGQAMKKDLLWTPKNELEQKKQEGQPKIQNDDTLSYNGKKLTYKDDNDIRQITNNYVKIRTTKNYDLRHETKTEQQDNDD